MSRHKGRQVEGSAKAASTASSKGSKLLQPTAEELRKSAMEEERQAKLLAVLAGYKDKNKEPAELKLTEVEEGQTSEVRKSLMHRKRETHRAEILMQEGLQSRGAEGAARLEARAWDLDEHSRVEDRRALLAQMNTEVQEQIVLEVDVKLAEQQALKAARLYAKKQIELGLPDWFKTLQHCIRILQAEGHSEKLRWRSQTCALLKRCIAESAQDLHAPASRETLRVLVLTINQYRAADIIGSLSRVKDAYIELCEGNGSKFGKDTSLLRASDSRIDRTSVVPLERTDWSQKLDEADLSRQSMALHSTESWSTLSRPVSLTGTEISSLFDGDPAKLAVKTFIDSHGAAAQQAKLLPGTGPMLAKTLPKPVLKGISDKVKRGGLKGVNAQIHPACQNEEQAQGISRMRSAAAMGNFELCRSVFLKNFDTPKRVREFFETKGYKQLSVGRFAPSMDIFRILMMAFKNAAEVRFEDAFEVVDLVESYGFSPDVAMYNIMMRACEKESRWRRALSMYKDLIGIHRLVPNVQTFDVLIDCCRHSLEDPGTIYETLRAAELPHDFCYKCAVCNCGNRIPYQVMQETMYDIEDAGVPEDGRFERALERQRAARQNERSSKGVTSPEKSSPTGASNTPGRLNDVSVITFDSAGMAALGESAMSVTSATLDKSSNRGASGKLAGHRSRNTFEINAATGQHYVGGAGVAFSGNMNAYVESTGLLPRNIDAVLDSMSLEEMQRKYKWELFNKKMKKQLPGTSPVVNGDFGKLNQPFNVQLSRNLPYEKEEYLEKHIASHFPPALTAPVKPGGGFKKEGIVLGGDHTILYLGSLNHQKSVSFKPADPPSPTGTGTTNGHLNTNSLGSSRAGEKIGVGTQPSWISDMEGEAGSHTGYNEYHESYVASHAHSQNALRKNTFAHRSEYDSFNDPTAAGADIIPEEKKIFEDKKTRSSITYSEHGTGASALDRWRERKEIIEYEAALLEQAMTPINPDSHAYFEEKESMMHDSKLGSTAGVDRPGSVADTITYTSEHTHTRTLKNLNMDAQGNKLGPKRHAKPSVYGYNATVANKEHREKKQLEREKAERLAKDLEEYKKVQAVEEAEAKKLRRFGGSSDVSLAGTSSVASVSNHDLASPASWASQKEPSHLPPTTGSPQTFSLSAAGSENVDHEFSYPHMLEKVEQERKEQKELALKATQMALAKDPTRLPKFRNRTNQQVQQKPLRKLPNSYRIMATVAEQIVMGGDHADALRHRPGYPMTNEQ